MSVRLYIGNLPHELENEELETLFADAGEGVSAKLVTDRKTGKCRGFGFVTVEDDSKADGIIEKYNGFKLKDSEIKVEKAQPRTSSEPAERKEKTRGGSGGGSARRGGSPSKGKAAAGTSSSSSSSSSESLQPDPRWASELEKLKQMLASNAQ